MLELLFVLLCGFVAGGLLGWMLGRSVESARAAVGKGTSPGGEESEDSRRLDHVARQIRLLTLNVATDVSAHQSRVTHIANALEQSPEAILETVAELAAANHSMQVRLEESQKQLRDQSRQLQSTRRMANTDALTGLANRRVLDDQLEMITQRADTATPRLGTIAMIDIDHFKSINDTYGHNAGDAVISRVAELIDARTGAHALCARYGGEEFAVVSETFCLKEMASQLDTVRQELESSRLLSEAPGQVITFSCGVAERQAVESSEHWMKRADQALYAAKNDGRNNVHLHDGRQLIRVSGRSGEACSDTATSQEPGASPKPKVGSPQSLIAQFREKASQINFDQVALAAIAIRLPGLNLSGPQRAAILNGARAALRTVDKLEYEDERTMVGMSVISSKKQAGEYASQLLSEVNKSLLPLCPVAEADALASVGFSVLDGDSSADDIFRAAIAQAAAGCPHRVGVSLQC